MRENKSFKDRIDRCQQIRDWSLAELNKFHQGQESQISNKQKNYGTQKRFINDFFCFIHPASGLCSELPGNHAGSVSSFPGSFQVFRINLLKTTGTIGTITITTIAGKFRFDDGDWLSCFFVFCFSLFVPFID